MENVLAVIGELVAGPRIVKMGVMKEVYKKNKMLRF